MSQPPTPATLLEETNPKQHKETTDDTAPKTQVDTNPERVNMVDQKSAKQKRNALVSECASE